MGDVATFSEDLLQQICDVLADSAIGLTGSEIGTYLLRMHIADPGPGVTKRIRLFEALRGQQSRDRAGDIVWAFLQTTLDPSRYAGNLPVFETRRQKLNVVLGKCGFEMRSDGRAYALGSSFPPESGQGPRTVAALIEPLAATIRQRSGLKGSGLSLVDLAFNDGGARGLPLIAFNDLRTPDDQTENAGLVTLLVGFFRTCSSTVLNDHDLAELGGVASFLGRRLARAVPIKAADTRPPTRPSHQELGH